MAGADRSGAGGSNTKKHPDIVNSNDTGAKNTDYMDLIKIRENDDAILYNLMKELKELNAIEKKNEIKLSEHADVIQKIKANEIYERMNDRVLVTILANLRIMSSDIQGDIKKVVDGILSVEQDIADLGELYNKANDMLNTNKKRQIDQEQKRAAELVLLENKLNEEITMKNKSLSASNDLKATGYDEMSKIKEDIKAQEQNATVEHEVDVYRFRIAELQEEFKKLNVDDEDETMRQTDDQKQLDMKNDDDLKMKMDGERAAKELDDLISKYEYDIQQLEAEMSCDNEHKNVISDRNTGRMTKLNALQNSLKELTDRYNQRKEPDHENDSVIELENIIKELKTTEENLKNELEKDHVNDMEIILLEKIYEEREKSVFERKVNRENEKEKFLKELKDERDTTTYDISNETRQAVKDKLNSNLEILIKQKEKLVENKKNVTENGADNFELKEKSNRYEIEIEFFEKVVIEKDNESTAATKNLTDLENTVAAKVDDIKRKEDEIILLKEALKKQTENLQDKSPDSFTVEPSKSSNSKTKKNTRKESTNLDESPLKKDCGKNMFSPVNLYKNVSKTANPDKYSLYDNVKNRYEK